MEALRQFFGSKKIGDVVTGSTVANWLRFSGYSYETWTVSYAMRTLVSFGVLSKPSPASYRLEKEYR